MQPRIFLGSVLFLSFALCASAQSSTGPSPASQPEPTPDPREIPVPPIKTSFPDRPGLEDLPVRRELPDVLTSNDGSRVTTPEQWLQRRKEIREILEHYAVGHAPPAPGNVKGRELKSQDLAGGRYRYRLVHLSFGPGGKLGFDIGIFTPASGGPFPVAMAPGGTPPGAQALPRLPNGPTQGKGTNVLLVVGGGKVPSVAPSVPPSSHDPKTTAKNPWRGPVDPEQIAANSVALARGYAYVTFNYNDLGEDTTLRLEDGSWAYRTTRFFPAYPGYDWGLLASWAWGVSRIVDYLETDPAFDRTQIIVTGASRTGKSAMVAAAFDDRIALGAPVVTGGGGIGAYRLCGPNKSETLDIMEKKYPNWFSPHLHAFRGQVDRLPFDQHWFLALCAPRAFIALEGTSDVISLPAAVRASLDGARPAYALFDATERLGVNYANHGHTFNADDWNALLDFADRHLRGRKIDRRFDAFPADTTTQP